MVMGQKSYSTSRWRGYPKKRLARRIPVKKQVERAVARTIPSRYKDTDVAITTVYTGGGFYSNDLTSFGQGNTVQTREGNKLVPEWLQVNGVVYGDQSASADATLRIRVMLVQWKTNTASKSPVASDIVATTTYINSLYNRDEAGEFKVLADRRFFLAGQPDGIPNRARPFKFRIPGSKMLPVKYNAGANTGDNHIFMIAYSEHAVADPPSLQFNARMQFHA